MAENRNRGTLKEMAGQLLDGKMVLSKEGFSEVEKAYLALIITVVEIINGAAYLFERNVTKDMFLRILTTNE